MSPATGEDEFTAAPVKPTETFTRVRLTEETCPVCLCWWGCDDDEEGAGSQGGGGGGGGLP